MDSALPRLVTPQFQLVWLANFAVFFSIGILILALPLYARDSLAASNLAVGIAVGVGSITAVLVGPPSGRISDRRGRKSVAFAGALLMLAGYLGLALEPELPAVVALRLLAGAGEAAFVVGAFTMIADLAPEERRGEAFSLLTVGSYTGLALGPLVANFLLGDARYALVWLAAAGSIALAAAVALAVSETRPESDEDPQPGWLPPRSALLPGLVILFALAGFGGFSAFGALYARELGLDRPGVVFFVLAAVVIVVRAVGRRMPDRLGARPAAALACVLIALGLATIAAWGSQVGLLVGTTVFAAGHALAYPAVSLLALARARASERSAALGSVSACVDIALAGGAFALGVVAEVAGYRGVFVAGAAIALAGLLLLARLGVSGAAEAAARPAS